MDVQKKQWEESYVKKENWILAPKEQVVKFLSRFVRRRLTYTEFDDRMDFSGSANALDFGCGIGRQAILLREYGFNAYGVDLSEKAIQTSKQLCRQYGFPEMESNFSVSGQDGKLPFENDFFKLTISDSVLDSMHFEIARSCIREIDRVTSGYFYCSLISGSRMADKGFEGEVIVEDAFEKGTVQSYYSQEKIRKLFSGTSFEVVWSSLVMEDFIQNGNFHDRYFVVATNASP